MGAWDSMTVGEREAILKATGGWKDSARVEAKKLGGSEAEAVFEHIADAQTIAAFDNEAAKVKYAEEVAKIAGRIVDRIRDEVDDEATTLMTDIAHAAKWGEDEMNQNHLFDHALNAMEEKVWEAIKAEAY